VTLRIRRDCERQPLTLFGPAADQQRVASFQDRRTELKPLHKIW
jgi:hypothetical protein